MSMCCSCGRFLRKELVFTGRIDGFQPKKSKKPYLKVHFQYGPNVDKDPADDEETDDDGGDEPAASGAVSQRLLICFMINMGRR